MISEVRIHTFSWITGPVCLTCAGQEPGSFASFAGEGTFVFMLFMGQHIILPQVFATFIAVLPGSTTPEAGILVAMKAHSR